MDPLNLPAFALFLLLTFSKGTSVANGLVDQTGSVERFDFRMQWTIGENSLSSAADEPGGTNFMEALKEQLGLRIKSSKAVVDAPVIAHVELPTEN
jgi:bla regulator protein blaR1